MTVKKVQPQRARRVSQPVLEHSTLPNTKMPARSVSTGDKIDSAPLTPSKTPSTRKKGRVSVGVSPAVAKKSSTSPLRTAKDSVGNTSETPGKPTAQKVGRRGSTATSSQSAGVRRGSTGLQSQSAHRSSTNVLRRTSAVGNVARRGSAGNSLSQSAPKYEPRRGSTETSNSQSANRHASTRRMSDDLVHSEHVRSSNPRAVRRSTSIGVPAPAPAPLHAPPQRRERMPRRNSEGSNYGDDYAPSNIPRRGRRMPRRNSEGSSYGDEYFPSTAPRKSRRMPRRNSGGSNYGDEYFPTAPRRSRYSGNGYRYDDYDNYNDYPPIREIIPRGPSRRIASEEPPRRGSRDRHLPSRNESFVDDFGTYSDDYDYPPRGGMSRNQSFGREDYSRGSDRRYSGNPDVESRRSSDDRRIESFDDEDLKSPTRMSPHGSKDNSKARSTSSPPTAVNSTSAQQNTTILPSKQNRTVSVDALISPRRTAKSKVTDNRDRRFSVGLPRRRNSLLTSSQKGEDGADRSAAPKQTPTLLETIISPRQTKQTLKKAKSSRESNSPPRRFSADDRGNEPRRFSTGDRGKGSRLSDTDTQGINRKQKSPSRILTSPMGNRFHAVEEEKESDIEKEEKTDREATPKQKKKMSMSILHRFVPSASEKEEESDEDKRNRKKKGRKNKKLLGKKKKKKKGKREEEEETEFSAVPFEDNWSDEEKAEREALIPESRARKDSQVLEEENDKLRTDLDYLQVKVNELESRQAELADLEGLQETVFNEIESFRDTIDGFRQGDEYADEQMDLDMDMEDMDMPLEGEEDMTNNEEMIDNGAKTFPHDTFSFMIISPLCSTPFFLSVLVFLIQITIFSAVAANSIVGRSPENPLGLPVNVDTPVRVVQLIAILIAVATQDDIRTAMNLTYEGYDTDELQKSFEHIAKWQWVLSNLARFIMGSVGLLVTFLLIVTTEDVLRLLLSFMAMEFVSQLDEVVFFLSDQGFTGRANKLKAMAVVYTTFQVEAPGRKCLFYVIQFLILLSMLGGWSCVIYFQIFGKFLSTVVWVEFGDDYASALGTFTGLYERRHEMTGIFDGGRFQYVERRSGRAMVGYCNDIKSWTFSIDTEDPCDWVAKSSKTFAFDVLQTISDVWFIRNAELKDIILQNFLISSFDCDDTTCNGRGSCTDGVCSCKAGWDGLRCEYETPCSSLEIDESSPGFLDTRSWSSTYNILKDQNQTVQVYDRPVYVSDYSDGSFDIIFFVGRRWVATHSDMLPVVVSDAESGKQGLADFFSDNFHAYWSNYSISFVSENQPMSVDATSDSNTPIGFTWFRAARDIISDETDLQVLDPDDPEGTNIICASCSEDANPCFYGGVCVDGKCECSTGSLGMLCQIPPVANGHCDPYFNTPEFDYDGGDCCESTCVSTDEFICGADESGYGKVGYFFCHLPLNEWRPKGSSISGEIFLGSASAMAMSANGAVLAIGEPRKDRVRLFDKDGSKWIERREPLVGPSGTGFGGSVAISIGSSNGVNAVDNPTTVTPIILAVGAPSSEGGAYVRVYQCFTARCVQIGNDLIGFGGNDKLVLDMSHSGNVVAVGALTAIQNNPVVVFERNVLEETWFDRSFAWSRSFDDPDTTEFLSSLSLSGDGKILAVRSWTYLLQGASMQRKDVKQIFEWMNNVWIGRGSQIINNIPPNSNYGNGHSHSIALSDDGSVLAVGSLFNGNEESGVQVFNWTANSESWETLGPPIVSNNGHEGWSIAVSANGMVVAVGSGSGSSDENDPSDGNTAVRTYIWDGDTWAQLGESLPGGYASPIALSNDGTILAIGMQSAQLNEAGITSVYEYSFGKKCPDTSSLLHISVTTDNNPGDTSWTVSDDESGLTLMEGGPYDYGYLFPDYLPNDATFEAETCIPKDGCTFFSIYDKVDFQRNENYNEKPDGTNDPAWYSVTLDGQKIAGARLSGAMDRVNIGNCLQCRSDLKKLRLFIRACAPIAWEVRRGNEVVLNGNNQEDYPKKAFDCSFDKQSSYSQEMCIGGSECVTFNMEIPSGSDWIGFVRNEYLFQYRLYIDDEEFVNDVYQIRGSDDFATGQNIISQSVGFC